MVYLILQQNVNICFVANYLYSFLSSHFHRVMFVSLCDIHAFAGD